MAGCTALAHAGGVADALIEAVEGADQRARLEALYLLPELTLDADQTDRVENACARTRTATEALLCAYALYGLTQEARWRAAFVASWPAGAVRETPWHLLTDETALRWPAGVITLMEAFAADDDRALVRLIGAARAADGAHAETLAAALDRLRTADPVRFARIEPYAR